MTSSSATMENASETTLRRQLASVLLSNIEDPDKEMSVNKSPEDRVGHLFRRDSEIGSSIDLQEP